MVVDKFSNLMGWEIHNKINIYKYTDLNEYLISNTKKKSEKLEIVGMDYDNEKIEDILTVEYIGNSKVKISSNLIINGNKRSIYYMVNIEDYFNVLKTFGSERDLIIRGKLIITFQNGSLRLVPKHNNNELYKEYEKFKSIKILKEESKKSSTINKSNLKPGHVYKDENGSMYLIYGIFYNKIYDKTKRVIVCKRYTNYIDLMNFKNNTNPFDKNEKYIHEDAYTYFETQKFVEDLGLFIDLSSHDVLNELNNMYSISNESADSYFNLFEKYPYFIGLTSTNVVKSYILKNRIIDFHKIKEYLFSFNNSDYERSYEYFIKIIYDNLKKYKFYNSKAECENDSEMEEKVMVDIMMDNIMRNKNKLNIYYEIYNDINIEFKISVDRSSLEKLTGKIPAYNREKTKTGIVSMEDFLNKNIILQDI